MKPIISIFLIALSLLFTHCKKSESFVEYKTDNYSISYPSEIFELDNKLMFVYEVHSNIVYASIYIITYIIKYNAPDSIII